MSVETLVQTRIPLGIQPALAMLTKIGPKTKKSAGSICLIRYGCSVYVIPSVFAVTGKIEIIIGADFESYEDATNCFHMMIGRLSSKTDSSVIFNGGRASTIEDLRLPLTNSGYDRKLANRMFHDQDFRRTFQNFAQESILNYQKTYEKDRLLRRTPN